MWARISRPSTQHGSREQMRLVHCSDSRVPLVALIFPVAALTPGDLSGGSNVFDALNVLGHFVAQLSLYPQSKRRAVLDRELVEGHCGQLPESQIPGMRTAQVVL